MIAFRDAHEFEAWLEHNADLPAGVWLKLAKKGSGIPSLTSDEAVNVGLCFGWISGQRKALDDVYYLQKYVPRRPGSRWSQINVAKVEALTAAGRMRPRGVAEVDAAKADGRWDAAYAPMRSMTASTIPADLRAAIDANSRARKTFATLSRPNLFSLAYRTNAMKTPAGRAKKIATLVAMLARGETLHPNAPRRASPPSAPKHAR